MPDAADFAVSLRDADPTARALTETTYPDHDGLGAARGLLSGIILAIPFWALVAYLVW